MKPQKTFRDIAFVALIACLSPAWLSHAATITWTNTSGGNWSVAANWNPHQVPTNADTALITAPGTYAVTFDFTADWRSFYPAVTVGAGGGAAGVQTLVLTNYVAFYFTNLVVTNGGVLAVNHAHVGLTYAQGQFIGQVITVNGGVVNASNCTVEAAVTVTNGGRINSTSSGFTSATVANGGWFVGQGSDGFTSLTVASGGFLNEASVGLGTATVANGGTMDLTGAVTGWLVNSGAVNFTNAAFQGIFGIGGLNYDGGIVNKPGGRIKFNGSSFTIAGGYQTHDRTYFTNQGSLTVIGSTTLAAGAFDNSQGALTNLSGTLSLGTLVTNFAGIFYTAPGAVTQLAASWDITTPGSPLVFSGGGSAQLVSGTLYLPSNSIPNLDLQGDLLYLGPDFQGGTITNLTLDGIELWNNRTVSGRLNVTNSWLDGNITVASGGTFFETNANDWGFISVASGGSATVEGCLVRSNVTVSSGAGLIFNGTNLLQGALTNSGTVALSGATIEVRNDSFNFFGGIQNLPGGMINFIGGGNNVVYNNGREFFHNRGAITQNIPGGTNSINIIGFENAQGTVTNLAGTLFLTTFQTNLSGVFDAAPGALIQISGGSSNAPVVPGAPLALVGGGQFQFVSSGPYVFVGGGPFQFVFGYLMLTANVIPNLALQSGTLEIGQSFQAGAITNLSPGSMVLSNALPVIGTLTATNHNFIYGNFTVANGGVFNSAATLNGNISIANGGLLSLAGGTTINTNGAVTLASGAMLNIVGTGMTLFGPLTNAGTLFISNSPPAFISGVLMGNDGGIYRGGLLNQSSGQIIFASDGTIVSTYGMGNEYFINQGHVTKTAGTNVFTQAVPLTSLNVAHTTNSGAITAQTGFITSAPFTLLLGSSLNVGINSATNYGSFRFNTNIVLGGAFNATLNNGYVPVNGTRFNVLQSYGSVLGTFSSLGLPPAASWQTAYGATNFILIAGSASPQFGALHLFGTNLVLNGIGGSPGSNYIVLVSTNLNLPLANWTAVITNVFDGSGQFHYTNAVLRAKPRQFYRFKLP